MCSRFRLTLLFVSALLAVFCAGAWAQTGPRKIPNEILVKFRPGVVAADKAAARALVQGRTLHDFAFIRVEHMKVEGMTADQAIGKLRNNPNVEYAEPNFEVTADLTPNDARFPELYAMRNTGQTGGTAGADIKATSAWDIFTGDPNLLVGVIDTGIDYNHPDLADNVWTNPGEIPGNGIDDDGNGYVDDVHGYDFVNNDGDPFDDNGHGSHVSGTIAGTGNNSIGVVGVNWHAKVAGIKFLSSAGSGSTAGAIAGVQYSIVIHCRLTSNSWGGGGFSQALLDAINAAGAANQLFVAAAGNSAQNTDTTPSYPAAYNSPYIISVAATDHNDNLASFSNYGATTVDLAAPGVNILSVQPGGGYQTLSGTSMATPHVSGVVALAMGRFPAASNLQIKQLVLGAVDVKPQLAGKCLTGGRLNAFLTIAEPDETPPGQVADLSTANAASNTIDLHWTATGDDGAVGRASSYEIRYSTSPITDLASFQAGTLVPGPDPSPAGSAETVVATGLSFNTSYYFALRAKDEFGNAGPVSNVATGTTLGQPHLSASPSSFSANLLTGGTADRTLSIQNTAAGTLDWSIATPQLEFSQPISIEPIVVGKGNLDTRTGTPVTESKGGPDGFGYRWVDSNESGGPAFNWVDITGIGTQATLTGDDAWSAVIPMGINFPFYGNSFNSLRVDTNGFLSFTTSTGDFYDNQPLPSSGGAANMVAPFWDDLDFGTTPRVYTYNDGTRFVVSWVGVPHYAQSPPAGGPYTFQAILYPTGEIVFQYLNMNAPLNGATVGIQNDAKNVGLNVAFNTSYVANNLAVRIVPLRQWLTVSPTSGRVLAGQSQDVNVRFDAAGLDGGTFLGSIRVDSNDPAGPSTHSAELVVTGAPDLAINPASFDFGTIFVGAHPSQTMTVSNPGTDVLNVTAISSGDPSVSVDQGVFTLAPHAARNVIVTFAPTAAGAVSTTLEIQSNDPDTPTKSVPVTGTAVPAPSFSVDPTSFDVSLLTNTATSRNLRVSNSGGSNYIFTAQAIVQTPTGAVVVKSDADNVDLAKDAPDVQFGPAPLKAGGPDVYGYTYQDSDEPGGPTFSWVDISATGTLIPFNGDDQTLGPFPVGFAFPFYGSSFNNFKLCTNGWLSFSGTTLTTFTNTSLPNTGSTVPPALLAPFWDDLDFRPTTAPNARAYYAYDGTKLVVQFKGVPRRLENGTTATNDFEMLLFPNGTIVYQYLTMNAVTKNSATIGEQNNARNDGLQVAFNASYVKNNLAVRFRPPARFLTVNPTSGTVPPGGFLDLTVGFDAAGLFGGDYAGAIRITGNDPVLPTRDVTAVLHVTGVPDIAVSPASIGFGVAYLGFPQLRQIAVQNVGTDVLSVSNITFDDPSYGVDLSSFTVPPLGNTLLFVSFNPSTLGDHPATMSIASDDPDTPNKTVPLTGTGLVAPDIRHDPSSLSATATIPNSTNQTLTLHNDGGSDLNFVVGTQITASSVPVYGSLDLGKDEADTRPGILGAGGPDAFGYRWRDSDEPGGPAFDWVDITSIGTPISFATGDDSNNQNNPIGFDFPFYGNHFNSVNICTNGWISFTNTTTAFTNNPLPSSGSPENLLAAFWDDLNPGTATPRVYRYTDGTRFIVSYVGVPRLSSGGPYTFQIILYPTGRVVYQYLDMQGTRLNEATVGIQNAAKNDGLTVAYNTAYVHNNLAVELATIPDYLTVNPTSGTIPAGGSADVIATFNTTGLFGGTYDGALRISSNDPDEQVVTVPTHLVAVGVPDVATVPANLNFGPVYIGLTKDLPLSIRSVGTDVLNLTGITFDNPSYSLVTTPTFPVSLGNAAKLDVVVRFTPTAPCSPCAGNLQIASNDPDHPTLAVPLTGDGVVPPEIVVTPTSLRAALATTLGPTAIQKTKRLVVQNTGGSELTWSAEALSALPASNTIESGETGKNEAGTPGAMGAGGPDAFGYRWADSDDPQGTPFSWIDITGVGTVVPFTGDDQNLGPFPLPFPFTFYGNTFNSFRVCSNGWISFTSSATTLTNVALPNASSSTPENLLAAFWDDLDLRSASGNGKVYSYYDGSKFIVSFVNVPRFSTHQLYTFQIILYPSGTIDYQYLSMQAGRLNEATIGIQNATKDVGLTVVYNAAYVKDDLRVRFTNQSGWLSVSPQSGHIAAGAGPDTILVTFNATGLADGDYTGLVRIHSNDIDEPLTTVPCDLHVGVISADFNMDPNTFNRGMQGNWVKGIVELPTGHDPRAILTSSVLLQRAVGVAPNAPLEYSDVDADNLEEADYKFSRLELSNYLTTGESVPVEMIGEEEDVTWFRDIDLIRVLPPHITLNGTPTRFVAGTQIQLSWDDPPDHTPTGYELWYSADGGGSWTAVAQGLTQRSYLWTVPDAVTTSGILELDALDQNGLMGSWFSAPFEIAAGTTAVGDGPRPTSFGLRLAGPNPAAGQARLQLAMPEAGDVAVRVYDVKGRQVRDLARGHYEPGLHLLQWDGRSESGSRAAAGIYFVRMSVLGRSYGVRLTLVH